MAPPNHHNRRNHRHPPPTLARSSKCRTLCDLPVEILYMIISHVEAMQNAWTMRVCTFVCHCLRAVSLEHHFGTRLAVRNIGTFDHLLSFLADNPKVCAKIEDLRMSGQTRNIKKDQYLPLTPIDDTVVLRLMQLLPNLKYLELSKFRFESPYTSAHQPTPHAQEDTPEPFHLQRLSLAHWSHTHYSFHHKSSTSALFRILSLFVVDLLDASWINYEIEASALDLAHLHRPLNVKELRLGSRPSADRFSTLKLLKAFQESLEPGALRILDAECRTVRDVPALGKLLARTGEGLTSLKVAGVAPYILQERKDWRDPLDSQWQSLNLTSCPKLESIKIDIFFRASSEEKQPTGGPVLSLAGAGILSQASGALRNITIRLHDLPRVTTLTNRRLLRLQAFENVITPKRFPLLQNVELLIKPEWNVERTTTCQWQHVVAEAQKALPKLHSRGLLQVTKY
ncbi:hypothetical protein BD311DRAFT_725035 [Dichomitus squalens]|uniref:F-box domain-containing protein n=1 Tax=Dichomitus squalens TaxID=114155 RepID=A0A4Q9MLU2_9APHY|nr:hypothetical protein BD311DRAFT_725035 [Dichomitus squalens]